MLNNIIVKRNQEVVEYYISEAGKYGVLVKISGYNEVRYGFVTTSGQVSKTYKTQRGMRNWVLQQSVTKWQQISTNSVPNECLAVIKKIGE